MQILNAATPEQYIDNLPEDRQPVIRLLREEILKNLPEGFAETINYGMIGYVVPHTVYPAGYHANPKLPLPFINIASQKNFISVYHMGIYSNPELLEWFKKEYRTYSKSSLDMGKGCFRFKKTEQIPYKLIGELASKISAEDWIKTYEKNRNRQENDP